jgi:hypothetical protein
LLKKRYDYDHTLKSVNKEGSKGVEIETGAVLPQSGQLRGFIKGKLLNVSLPSGLDKNEGNIELQTDAGAESKANLKLKGIAKGLSVNLLASSKAADKSFKRPIVGCEVEYQNENIAAQLNGRSDMDVHKVDGNVSVGYKNIAVGGSAVVDLTRGAQLTESNVGAEYVTRDFVASVCSEKNQSVLNAYYYQTVSANQQIGAQFKYELHGKQERSLSVGTLYYIDQNTNVKAKIDLPSGDIATAIEHRLSNPRCLLGLATAFNTKSQSFQADKMGLSITFGDY